MAGRVIFWVQPWAPAGCGQTTAAVVVRRIAGRVKGEEWFPVKCDMVAKQAVMNSEAGDGKTLKKDVCQAFTKDNAKDGYDFTAIKAN
jgi:hypothetical protein